MIAVDVPPECMPPRGDIERIRAAAAKRTRKAAKRLAERAALVRGEPHQMTKPAGTQEKTR